MVFRQINFGSGQYLAARMLRQSVLRAPLGLPLSDADLHGEESQLHFGLFNCDDELVACVIAVPDGAEKVRVRQTAVAPEYQRQGLASKMMRELEAKLRMLGVEVVTLHARQSAIGFYRNLGYEPVGPEFMEVTLPHQKMAKYLV